MAAICSDLIQLGAGLGVWHSGVDESAPANRTLVSLLRRGQVILVSSIYPPAPLSRLAVQCRAGRSLPPTRFTESPGALIIHLTRYPGTVAGDECCRGLAEATLQDLYCQGTRALLGGRRQTRRCALEFVVPAGRRRTIFTSIYLSGALAFG